MGLQMPELYYAMCFDGNDEKQSNFYHCIALAESEGHFKAIVSAQKELTFTKISTVTDYLKESGYKQEIIHLAEQVNENNPILFSKPIAFFNDQQVNERDADPNQAVDNGIVSVDIDYQKRDDFMKQAKTWLLRQAGYVQEDPRFSNIYTITDQEAAEQSILLIDAAQFPPNSIIYRFGERMHSLYDGERAVQMENVAPYLIDSQDIVDFLRNLREESELIFRNEEQGIDYTTEKVFKGIMLLKTKHSLEEVRKRLRRFTRVKTIDGYDEHGNPVNERWVYFRFGEQLTTQEWLQCSEAETTSYFMKPFDEILFARCDTCSFHKITVNKDKIIENPKYPNLNGGFLYTKRQQNAHLLGRKAHMIGETERLLFKYHHDLSKDIEDIRGYLEQIWSDKVKHHKASFNSEEYTTSCAIGLYMGSDNIQSSEKQAFLKELGSNESEIYQHKEEQLIVFYNCLKGNEKR